MKRVTVLVAMILLACNALLWWRLSQPDLDLSAYEPRVRYEVAMRMEVDLVGDPAQIRAYIPGTGDHQRVLQESILSSGLGHEVAEEMGNRQAHIHANGQHGHHHATYRAIIEIDEEAYALPDDLAWPAQLPQAVLGALVETDAVQVGHPEIVAVAQRLREQAGAGSQAALIQATYQFVRYQISNSDYERALDAVTALRWGEAFCGGKSRLLAALLRANNIPARLVGGVILERGAKTTSHLWCEAWVNGTWLPMDAVNGHYLFKPAHYLVLYYGDHALTTRTNDINFRYQFVITDHAMAPQSTMAASGESVAAYPVWRLFRESGVPLSLILILLQIPITVLVVLCARNIIGLPCFGTFVPAILALAFQGTGLWWGLILLTAVIVVGIGARLLFDGIQLLHAPRLALVLSVVVGAILFILWFSIGRGWIEPSGLALFPVIILVCMVEQCFQSLHDAGVAPTIRTAIGTAVIVAVGYLAVANPLLQTVLLVLPEVLLVVVAAYVLIGRYVGLRASELVRFRSLIASPAAPEANRL